MDKLFFDKAFDSLPKEITSSKPICSFVLGSGWNKAIEGMNVLYELPYDKIPGLGAATVIGHSGKLVLAEVAGGKTALVFCGRRHWYEGVSMESVVMPVEISRRLGVKNILLTNASGGISAGLKPGDMVILNDHLRLGAALSPLRGEHNPEWGDRFPDQSNVYNMQHIALLKNCAKKLNIKITEGVYVFACGPMFETPAEIRAYRTLGADVVGMSTVPEAIFASACGMNVAALSFVSNYAAGLSEESLAGTDVVECAKQHEKDMAAIIVEFLLSL